MRIEVRRTGGFAGIERRAEVDTAALADASVWHALVEAALAEAAPAEAAPVGAALVEAARSGPGGGPSRMPDGFSYEITVDGRTVRCAEPHLTGAQRELASRVLREGA
ncbi:protealysin inhibitor emfourin [Streptomyces sp. SS162]|uniref:protealysin inhibitor emfourin n=1 Tax=Streptomyces sp. SS162 TaxID=3108484 RepID=UPI002F3FC388